LDEAVTEAVLHAAFLPFGEIKDVSLPLDHGTQKNRGFGFVTFMERRAGGTLSVRIRSAHAAQRGCGGGNEQHAQRGVCVLYFELEAPQGTDASFPQCTAVCCA